MAIDAGYTITPLSGSGIQIQYSVDGSTWHATFTDGDVYMRQKVDGGEWTDAIKIVGEDGKNAIVMTSATTPSGEYEGQVGIWQNQIYFWTNGEWVNQTPELPTDAILHYSFDDVPDLPDGTPDFRYLDGNTYQGFTDNKISQNGYTTIQTWSNDNGNLKVETNGTNTSDVAGFMIVPSTTNEVIILELEVTSLSTDGYMRLWNGSSGTGANEVLRIEKTGVYKVAFINNATSSYPRPYIRYSPNLSATFTIKNIYVGNGSYNTPIIDNSGNRINAVNNGALAVQGVSGKGAYFLNGKYAQSQYQFDINKDFAISFWVKPDNNTTAQAGYLIRKNNQFHLLNGEITWATNALYLVMWDTNANQIGNYLENTLLPVKWSMITLTRNGNKLMYYRDGIKVKEITINVTLRNNDNATNVCYFNNTRPQFVDDLLIFNRALSDKEVLALYQNKANTPKYFTMSDYSLEQIDDDNVVDHLTEKPQLLSKWLEIYNAKNVSSALPTSNISTNGEYKGVINTANEVGVISTEQLENYIQATNALRSALWGTNGYLVDMNTDSTLNGNLDTLFANYRETLQIARTQITQQQASIASALSVVNSNPFQLIPVNSQGEVITGGYDNTGTRLQVFNGTTVLTPKSSSATLSNGEWKVTANGSGIVAGSQTVGTGDNKYIDFGNVSNMTAETAVITYTINVMLNNTPNTIYVVQKFGKSKEGADGRIYTLLPDFTAVKKSADGSVLTPSSVTVQAKSWTGSSIPELYGEGDLKAFENNVQVGTTVHGNSITVTPTGNYPVVVNLYRHGTNTLIDTVTIPILQEVKGDTGDQGEQGIRGNLTFIGTEIYNIRAVEATYALTTESTGITADDMPILVGDKYINSLTFDIWSCTTAGNASNAKWTYEGRQTDDKDNTNQLRFFGDGTRTKYNRLQTEMTQNEEVGENPFGGSSNLLKMTRPANVSASSRSVPVYNKPVKIEAGVNYRYACYVRKNNNKFTNYFGVCAYSSSGDVQVQSLSGSSVNSAYFCNDNKNFGTLNRWYLVIGYVTAYGVTTAPTDAGVYDMVTKSKVKDCTNYQFKDITEFSHTGTLIGYTASATTPTEEENTYIWDLRFDKLDGTEPSLEELLNINIDAKGKGNYISGTTYNKGDIVYYNGNSYICKVLSTTTVPTTTANWDKVADKGDNGTLTFTSDQTRSWTDSQWNDYSTAGRVTSWNNSTVEGMRVGDILQIPATLTQQGNITGVIFARITSIPTTQSGGLYQIPTVTLYGQKGNKGDKGDTGVGISAVTEYYLRNNSSTAPAFNESTLSNWSTTASNPISTAQYLWNAERITKSDGTYEYMTPHLAMKYTANGTAGKGIVSIKNYYLATSLDSGVTTDTQGWTEAVQTVSSTNRYLWNYEEITYTTGNPTKTSPAIIGTFGAVSQGNWTASHSYKVSDIVYYQGSSYICKTAHTSGSTFDSSKWNKLADKGADGKGVTSVIAYTALSTDTTKPASSAFTITAKSVDSTNRYLWRYEVTTYTDNSTTGSYADATIIGVWGNPGIDATSVSISSEQIEVMCGSGNGKFLGDQTQKITVYARKGSSKKACTLSFTSPASGTGITITKQNGTASADGYFNITFAENENMGSDSTNSFDIFLSVTVDDMIFNFTVKTVKASKGVYLGRCASKPSAATVTVYTGDTWDGSSVTKYAQKGDYVSVVNMTESDSNRGKMFQWNGSQWNEDGNTGHAMEALDDMLLMSDTLPDGSRATKFLDRLITNEVLAKRMTSLEVMFKEFVASFKGSNYESGDLSISMGKNPKNLYDDKLNFNIQSFLAMLPKSANSAEQSEMWRKEFYTENDDVYKKTDLITKGDISLGGALKTFDTVYSGANVEEQPFIYPDSFTSNDTVVFSVRQDMLRMFRCSNGTIYVYIGVLPSVQDQLAFSLSYTWNGNINQIYDIYQTYTEGQGFTEYIATSEGVYRYKDTESERFSLVSDKVFYRMNPYKGKVICWDDSRSESFLFDGTNLTQIDVIGDVFVEFTENLYVGYAKYSTNPIIEFYNCNEDGFNRVGYNNLQGKPIYNIDAYTHKRGNSAGTINKNNIYGLYAVNGKLYLSYDTTVTEGKACMILRSNDCGNTWDIISSVISIISTSTNSSRFLFGYNKDGLIVLCGSGTYSYSTNNGEKFTIKTTALSSWKWTGRGIEDFGQNSRDILIPYWSSGLKFKKLINVNTAEIFKKNISNQKGNLIKFRNGDGFSIQWGQTNNLGNASPASVKTAIISLTTGSNRQFYNNNYSVFVTLEGSTSGLEIAVTNKSSTGFTITAYNRNSETTVNNVVFHWLAIGNTDK